jgi:hypothetical protein
MLIGLMIDETEARACQGWEMMISQVKDQARYTETY